MKVKIEKSKILKRYIAKANFIFDLEEAFIESVTILNSASQAN